MFNKVFYKSVASILAGLGFVAEELDAHGESCLLKAEASRQRIIALELEVEELEDTALDAFNKARALRGVLNA